MDIESYLRMGLYFMQKAKKREKSLRSRITHLFNKKNMDENRIQDLERCIQNIYLNTTDRNQKAILEIKMISLGIQKNKKKDRNIWKKKRYEKEDKHWIPKKNIIFKCGGGYITKNILPQIRGIKRKDKKKTIKIFKAKKYKNEDEDWIPPKNIIKPHEKKFKYIFKKVLLNKRDVSSRYNLRSSKTN